MIRTILLTNFKAKWKFILPIFLVFLLAFTKEDPSLLKCKDFKLGKYELISDGNNKKYIIQRGENMQSEREVNSETGETVGAVSYYILNWKNDCEFNLMLDTAKSQYDKTDLFINTNGGLNMKIIKTEGKCVTIQTSLNGENPLLTTSCKIE